jgi:hypothetical protein
MNQISKFVLGCVLGWSIPTVAAAQQYPTSFTAFTDTPRHYICHYTNEKIDIDGKASESIWNRVPYSAPFVDIEGSLKPLPAQQTRVKMCWDDTHLYIYAHLEEKHIWGNLTQHDTIIYHNNDIEVFIDVGGQSQPYYEIEVNALNTIMDLMMVKPYRNGGSAVMNWDTKGLRSAVYHQGTLNNSQDTDSYWTVEMAIPFKALAVFGQRTQPQEGSMWRINFSRVQWQHEIIQGQYQKKPGLAEDNWVWSPQGIVDMHAPERWGFLQFTKEEHTTFNLPAHFEAHRFLWRVFYAQRTYHRQHKRYADQLEALGLQAPTGSFEMEATSHYYQATYIKDQIKSSINHDGKISAHHE